MNALVNAVGWTLLHSVWQCLLVAGVAAAVLSLISGASPQARYAVACGALLSCLCWPALELYLRLGGGALARMNGGLFDGALLPPVIDDDGALAWLQQHLASLVCAWALCAVLLAARMLAGLAWIAAMQHRRGATHALSQARLTRLAARCGLRRPVLLRVVPELASPITAGWWRPVVMVPAALIFGMPADLLEALLAHELAHIRRHDYLVNLLQNVIETLLFHHPAVWWLSGRIRIERELIADDFAVRQLGQPRLLARALSELERLQFSGHHLAQAANGGDLMARITRLVGGTAHAARPKPVLPVLALAAACLCVYVQAAVASHSAARHLPAVIDFSACAKPSYPPSAVAAGHTGTVTLSFLIGVDGKAHASAIEQSSGHPALDDAALASLRRCPFRPAIDDGRAVSSATSVQYVWRLE